MSGVSGARWMVAFAVVVMAVSIAVAEEKPPNMAEMWVVVPHDGHGQQFEDAFKAHIAMRAEKGDPRAWQVYQPFTGDDMNRYIIRSCCHSWTDMDKYGEWTVQAGTGEHWNTTVDKHVKEYEHYYSEIDWANSHWPQMDPPAMVGVTYYDVKFGAMQMDGDKAKLSQAAKEMKWPYNWSWVTTIGSEYDLALVVPYSNFSAMEPPEKEFMAMLTEKMGEQAAQELLGSWMGHFEDTDYKIFRRRAELSMATAEQ